MFRFRKIPFVVLVLVIFLSLNSVEGSQNVGMKVGRDGSILSDHTFGGSSWKHICSALSKLGRVELSFNDLNDVDFESVENTLLTTIKKKCKQLEIVPECSLKLNLFDLTSVHVSCVSGNPVSDATDNSTVSSDGTRRLLGAPIFGAQWNFLGPTYELTYIFTAVLDPATNKIWAMYAHKSKIVSLDLTLPSPQWTVYGSLSGSFIVTAINPATSTIYSACGASGSSVYGFQPDVDTTWSAIATEPQHVTYCGLAVWNNKLYLMGGGHTQILDLITLTWTVGSTPPTNRVRLNCAASPHGHNLPNTPHVYCFGGSGSLATNEGYNIGTDSWSTGVPLTQGRYNPGVAYLYDAYILITGGTASNRVELYDASTDTITMNVPQLNTARRYHGLVVRQVGNVYTAYAVCGWSNVQTTEYLTITDSSSGNGGQDPEFRSMDGLSLKYDGPCSYIVSTNKCQNKNNIYPLFEVISHHGSSRGRKISVVVIQQVTIHIWPTPSALPINVVLKSNHRVEINDTKVKLPYHDELLDLTLENKIVHGNKIRRLHVKTKFGLNLFWTNDAGGSFGLSLPHDLHVCGLLGNNNNNKEDDLQMRNGTILSYTLPLDDNLITIMGDTWMVYTPNQQLRCDLYPDHSLASMNQCTFNHNLVQQRCDNMLKKRFKLVSGKLLNKCFSSSKDYNSVDGSRIYDDCITELCACNKDSLKDCFPHVAIKEFGRVCGQNGVILPDIPWKE